MPGLILKADIFQFANFYSNFYLQTFSLKLIHALISASEHLSLVIKTVGYPTESQLSEWDEYAKKFINQFSNITVSSQFIDNFPEINLNNEAEKLAADLLFKMLKLDPNERFSVLQALKHPYLSRYYSEDEETNDIKLFVDSHENDDYNVSEWKTLIYNEIISLNSLQNVLNIDDQELPS
jgi:serine/threonine protein kinase